jgi:hypothetical protein
VRALLTAPTVLLAVLVGCAAPSTRPPAPTPNLEQTVQARVAGTVASLPAALATPTAAPVAPTQAAKPAAAPAQAPVTLSGKGIAKTDPFSLSAGSYEIHWQAVNPTTAPCFHGGSLLAIDQQGFFPQTVGNEMVPAGQTNEGATNAYNLKAGQYYLNMSSGCQWTVSILPR